MHFWFPYLLLTHLQNQKQGYGRCERSFPQLDETEQLFLTALCLLEYFSGHLHNPNDLPIHTHATLSPHVVWIQFSFKVQRYPLSQTTARVIRLSVYSYRVSPQLGS